jgi:hypothetical protein
MLCDLSRDSSITNYSEYQLAAVSTVLVKYGFTLEFASLLICYYHVQYDPIIPFYMHDTPSTKFVRNLKNVAHHHLHQRRLTTTCGKF